MAANYWSSTQRRFWTFTKQEIAEMRENLDQSDGNASQQYPLPETRLLNIYFHQQIVKFGKRLSIRQQALATAQVYLKRYYLKVPVRRTNPYLIIATAFYLACKMEECPQHIRFVMIEARNTWPEMPTADIPRLGECEFALIAELNSQLIVHHPYRTLHDLAPRFALTQDETGLASSIVNDHYLTDLPLLYPPHVLAVTAIFLALVLRPTQSALQAHASHAAGMGAGVSAAAVAGALQNLGGAQRSGGVGGGGAAAAAQGGGKEPQTKVARLVQWLAESEVDVAAMVDCIQEIVSLYEKWEQYQDKVCKEQIGRYVKARELDK
ncbi:RNA polymerase II holoenzyme cyclin-like subunit [Viridothelium virens]|uniref:RNA polymerase II holoenzyme cyclin-like subunit n=1 Tax=Viridothelium virens TaxID=1048519 RepID=A0A6A6GX79_VIRVR|nr:RNA polymerase II holoenzyme cyclin-like subunit [Viridothelium virens]